jgi:hypothetical protein
MSLNALWMILLKYILYASEYLLYDIIKASEFICLNVFYIVLLKWELICLNALYMILLKWELICVWMRFIWYYKNESLYLSECSSCDITQMRVGMCLNALYMILLKWQFYKSECALYDINKMRNDMCVNALYMILLKWDFIYIYICESALHKLLTFLNY